MTHHIVIALAGILVGYFLAKIKWHIRVWWIYLLYKLGIKKRGQMKQGAFAALFRPGLRVDFERSYENMENGWAELLKKEEEK